MYEDLDAQSFEDMSGLLESYYAVKNTLTRIHQKSADLRRVVQTALERTRKKYALQLKQLQDTEKREKYKVWGELIHTYGYGVPEGARSMQALNYYTNEEITIPLDSTLTAQENAKRYFDKYGKLKRTFEAVTKLLEETRNEIEHLESIQTALDMALTEEDLAPVREELVAVSYTHLFPCFEEIFPSVLLPFPGAPRSGGNGKSVIIIPAEKLFHDCPFSLSLIHI